MKKQNRSSLPNTVNHQSPSVVKKKIPLPDAQDHRKLTIAGVLEVIFEAFRPGVEIPDHFDFHISGDKRGMTTDDPHVMTCAQFHTRQNINVLVEADK